MSDLKETFSAFLDEELSDSERNEQINLASNDVNMRYRMQRYQLIGDVMRGDAKTVVSFDFSAQVRAEIDQLDQSQFGLSQVEELNYSIKESKASWLSTWFKPLSSLAVAASVAWVTVISLQTDIPNDTSKNTNEVAQVGQSTEVARQVQRLAQQPVMTQSVQVSSPALLSPSYSKSNWVSSSNQPISQEKLNAFLINHTEYSNSINGMVPHARVVGFDAGSK